MNDATRYQHILARDRQYDGQFITGVLTTGIYCLPSCPARKPKPENVRFFVRESQAIKAGLRPCLRCRPDLFYRGASSDETIYAGLHQCLQTHIAQIADIPTLAKRLGISRSKLNDLCREHGHTTPATLLRRYRLDAAAEALLADTHPVLDIAYGLGFASESGFHRQFLDHFALTPSAYRALPTSSTFRLRLPADYQIEPVLGYLGRDAAGPAERREGNTLVKALLLDGQPVRLRLQLTASEAVVTVAGGLPTRELMVAAHHAVLRMLGLTGDAAGLDACADQALVAKLTAGRRGLHFPLAATVFESLVWAIVGQQVNLTFAAKLRGVVIRLAGRDAGEGFTAHPDIAAVAALDPLVLGQHQFSRAKASYLVGTAQTLLASGWDIDTMAHESVPAVLRKLTALRGIGPWTAQYTLLRGAGFADCVPVGDAGLVVALQRFFDLPERPNPAQTQALMAAFAPCRSMATAHLWASLKAVD